MRKELLLLLAIPIALFIIFSISGFPLTPTDQNHRIIINFQDGSSTAIPLMDITYQDKPVTSVTYEVTNKNYDLTLYDPYFETPMGLCELEGGFNGMWEVPIYRLINYTVDDGFYDISLIPRGVISLEGNEISLPEQIDFTIHIEDDRTISIILDN